jgi:non-heme chloroperoxidase
MTERAVEPHDTVVCLPKDVCDGLQAQLAANRARFQYDVPAGPFYGYNRPGAKPSQGVIWKQNEE